MLKIVESDSHKNSIFSRMSSLPIRLDSDESGRFSSAELSLEGYPLCPGLLELDGPVVDVDALHDDRVLDRVDRDRRAQLAHVVRVGLKI